MSLSDSIKDIPNKIKSSFSETEDTSKESLTSADFLQSLMGGKGVRNGFISDIYNEEIKTPHQEMQAIREMILMNAFVESAVDTVADLLLGKYQKVVSEDEETQKFFNDVFIPNSNLRRSMEITAKDFIGFGNYYFEKLRGRSSGSYRSFEPIAHPERMWRIEDDRPYSYVLEVPRQIADKDTDLKQFTVGYGRHDRHTVHGVSFGEDEIEDGGMGQGDYRYYGRSPLASTLSDHKILKEIERSMAIFARYKSVAKKLISVKGPDGEPLSPSEFDDTIRDWNQLNDFENFTVNGKEFDISDMDYAGNQVNFKPMTDYLKRKITSVLGPEFYFHGENTTHAVSNSQQTTFYLRIQSWRQQFIEPWNECLKEVARQNGFSDDVHWELGPFDFETDAEKREKAIKAFNAGAITINEAREMMGIDEAEDEEVGRAYKWDVQDQQPMQPLQQKLEDLIEENEED